MRIVLVTLVVLISAASPSSGDAAAISSWVDNLRSDDVRKNATRAVGNLTRAGAEAVPTLERALGSGEHQQRRVAATILGRFASEPYLGVAYTPTPEHIVVLIECLASDDLPIARDASGEETSYTPADNAAVATRVLIAFPNVAYDYRVELEDVIADGDTQARFLAAYILGMNGVEEAVTVAAPVLVEHLRDNEISSDAVWAAAALYRFGDAVLPHLKTDGRADEQQLRITAHLYEIIAAPPQSQEELIDRGIDLSCIYHDAAIEYTHGRPQLEWWAFED